MQAVVLVDGVLRFKANDIVAYLLEAVRQGEKADMNTLAQLNFGKRDREQFAQLIGYTVRGYAELRYASKKSVKKALKRGDRLLQAQQNKDAAP